MKYILITFSLLFIANLNGQNPTTEKFIRIVGLSEKTIDYDKIMIDYSLSEIEPNEYKQIRHKSLEDVQSEFISQLNLSGLNEENISSDAMTNLSSSRYSKSKSRSYSIVVKNENELEKFKSLDVDGLKILKANYVYSDDFKKYTETMILEAIKDAKRKAKNIAKAIDREVGNLLNIDDKVGMKTGSKYDKKNSQKKLTYSINVTFELK